MVIIESRHYDWDGRCLYMVSVKGADGGYVVPMMLTQVELSVIHRLGLAIKLIQKHHGRDWWPGVEVRLPTEEDIKDEMYPEEPWFTVWEEWGK